MSSNVSSGKVISAVFVTGVLVAGNYFRQRRIDREAIARSLKALQDSRAMAQARKDAENL